MSPGGFGTACLQLDQRCPVCCMCIACDMRISETAQRRISDIPTDCAHITKSAYAKVTISEEEQLADQC